MSSIPCPVLVLPGYGGSGPAHWQTLWERAHGFTRVEEPDWDHPDREVWVASLDAAVSRVPKDAGGVVLVAHSLACLQVAHWVAESARRASGAEALEKVRAALLVAPPDPDGPAFPRAARGFERVPDERFPFPALVVGSTDDPYAAPRFAGDCARAWGARFVSAGPKGHLNAASGLGEWEEGWGLLRDVVGETSGIGI